MSTKDALPSWLRTTFIGISDAPWTNIKSMNGEILAYATAVFLAVAAIREVAINEGVLYAWLIFLSGKIGFAMGGAWVKRATYLPSPPATQDVEDAAATTPTPGPEKVLTKADAQKAAEALEARNREMASQTEAVG